MQQPLKDTTLMRMVAAVLVEDVSDLCRRMASLNRRAIRSEPARIACERRNPNNRIRALTIDG